MFEKIIALYDLSSPSEKALEWGLRMGEKFHSQLKVLHVLPRTEHLVGHDFLGVFSEMAPKVREDIDRKVRLLAEEKSWGELKGLQVEVLAGKPIPRILKAIGRESPELVIVGSHGRTGLSHVLLGSVAEKVVRHSPSPVLVAKKKPEGPLKTILVPVDIHEPAEEAFLFSQALAQSPAVQLELLYVLPLSDLAGAYWERYVPGSLLDIEPMKKTARERLDRIVRKECSANTHTQVAEGPVALEICKHANAVGADLILIPTHGRKGWDRLFMGSVAEQVVRYAPCSVLAFCPEKSALFRKKWIEELSEPLEESELGGGD